MDEQLPSISTKTRSATVRNPHAAVTLIIVLVFAVFPLLDRTVLVAVCAALAVLTAVGWIRRWREVAEIGAFCASCIVLALLSLPSQLWLAMGLATYAAVVRFGPHESVGTWFNAGRMTREVRVWMAVCVLATGATLAIWFAAADPDITDLVERFVPDWPVATLVLGGLGFSALNAAVEEFAYRGVLMEALDRTIGVGALSLLIQAAAFGVLHINGFPRGWTGVMLAFMFGVVMGVLRRKSGGLLAPWATHVAADIVIVTIVVAYAKA